MKTPSLVSRRAAILSVSIAGLLTPGREAGAATFTWNGRTANWSVGAEWMGGAAPASDPANVLVFGSSAVAGPAAYTATHNLGAGFRLNALSFTSADAFANTLGSDFTGTLDFVASAGVNPAITQSGAGAMIVDPSFSATAPLTLTGAGTGVVTLNGMISGPGGLNFSGASWRITNSFNDFTGGLTVGTGAFVELAPAGDFDQPIDLTPGFATIVGGNAAANPLAIDGGILKVTTTGGGNITFGGARPITFGAAGGTMDLRNSNLLAPGTQGGGFAGGTSDLALTLNNAAGAPAVIQINGGEAGLSSNNANNGDWRAGDNALRVTSYAGTGPLRIEVTNGALFVNRAATVPVPVTVRGVAGGDPTSGPDASVNIATGRMLGRMSLDNQATYNYTAGLRFEGAVQVALANAARALDGNITVAGTAGGTAGYVAFSGRGTGTALGPTIIAPGTNAAGQNVLYIGQGGNDTLTIEDGGIAVFDSRIRHDQTNNNGVLLNATAVIEGGAELRISQSLSRATGEAATAAGQINVNSTTSAVGHHIIDGDIQGRGTTSKEAVFNIAVPFPAGTDTNNDQVPDDAFGDLGGVVFRTNVTATTGGTNGADLIVNGTGQGGLRVTAQARPDNLFTPAGPDPVSNVAKVNNLLTPARIGNLTGTGGFLTVAPRNEAYTFPNAEWSVSVPVGLRVNDHAAGTDVTFDAAKTTWSHNLAVDAGAELSTGANPFTLSAGTLAGPGTVTGAGGLIVDATATISPGYDGVGTITVGNLTLAGTYLADVTAASASDILAVQGDITLGAGSVLAFTAASVFNLGTYTVGTYSGTRTGSFAGLTGAPLGYTVDYGTAGEIRIVYTPPAVLTWNGAPGAVWSTNPADANWQGAQAFTNDNAVLFDDTAVGSTSVTLGGSVQPLQITFNNSDKAYTLAGSAGNFIGGVTQLIKNGTNSLTLSGPHTYTGGTTINAGTLILGADNSLPDAGVVSVSAGGTLDAAGRTETVASLAVGGNVTAGNISAGGITLSAAGSIAANLVLAGDVAKTGAGSTSISGNVDLGGLDRVFDVADGGAPDLTISGVAGNGAFVKNGPGVVVLTGANTYALGTTVNAGTLRAGIAGAIPNGAATINGGTLDLNGFARTFNTLSGSGGTLALGAAVLTIDNAGDDTLSAGITGAGGSVVKNGAGIQTLAGAGTFDGGLTINAGRVNLTNAAAAGAGPLTVMPGTVLQLGATIGNAVSVTDATLSSQNGNSLGSGIWTINGSSFVHTYNEGTNASSEFIFTGALAGAGNILLTPAPGQVNADPAQGFRLRGTIAGTYTGTLTAEPRSKFEIQLADSTAPNPFGAGKIILNAGTSTGGLLGTYPQLQPRLAAGGQTYALGHDVTVSGPGYVNANVLGGSDVVAQFGKLIIGAQQILGASKNDDNNRSIEFPAVTLTGGMAEFRAYDPDFAVQTNAARGGSNILLGVISESAPGAGIVFKSGTSAGRTYFNEVRGVSTYTGPTDVQTGTLRIGLGGSIASSSEIHVAAGATLDVSDNFSGYAIPAGQRLTGEGSLGLFFGKINLSGTLAPGTAGIGTLSGFDLLLNGDAALAFELAMGSAVSDHVSLIGSFAKGAAGPFRFDFQGGGMGGATYSLFDFTSTTFAAGDFSFTNLAPGLDGSFQLTGNELLFTVIPEPGAAALILGALGTVLGLRRRR